MEQPQQIPLNSLPKSLLQTLRQMADNSHSLNFPQFVAEILEVSAAEYRKMRLKPNFPLGSTSDPEEIQKLKNLPIARVSNRLLDAGAVQRILFLANDKKMTAVIIAERLSCSETSVRRVLDRIKQSNTHLSFSTCAKRRVAKKRGLGISAGFPKTEKVTK